MSDLGLIYSFCVIEATSVSARGRAIGLVAKLLHAGFVLSDSHYALNLLPLPGPPNVPMQPLKERSSIYTLVRQPPTGSGNQRVIRNEQYDQAVIDAQISEAKKDTSGQLEVQIA